MYTVNITVNGFTHQLAFPDAGTRSRFWNVYLKNRKQIEHGFKMFMDGDLTKDQLLVGLEKIYKWGTEK